MATTATPTKTHYSSPRRPARFHYKPRHNPKVPPTPPSPLTLKCGFCKEVKRQASRNDIYSTTNGGKIQFKALADFTDEQRLKVCIHRLLDIAPCSTHQLSAYSRSGINV